MIVGLVSNSRRDETRKVAHEVAVTMESRGLKVIQDWHEGDEVPDLLVVFGGDGTILGTARRCGHLGIPLLTINLGRVGFLAELEVDELSRYLQRIIDQDYRLENRMMLRITARRGERIIFQSEALNEATVLRQGIARMIRLQVLMDGKPLARYVADGIICATPTGSTAYSLSAGGPVLMPDAQVMVLTPVCPYVPALKPLVMDANHSLSIIPETEKVVLTVDGQDTVTVSPGDEVEIGPSPYHISLVKLKERSILEVLNRKLQL
ncbi:MAG: NAD(+)/NADH kinase [Bacillota bacterium]